MLIVAGWFEVDPGDRDAFLASRADSMTRSRSEPGCLEYVFSADPMVPGRVVLYECWLDKASLATHLALPRVPSAEPAIAVIKSQLQQYEISLVGPLGS
jgi:quinol monooxygenase YgiN